MTTNIRKHWDNVRALGCCISHNPHLTTLHHVHGGSVIDQWGSAAMPGMAQKQNDWLVIPIHERFHTGVMGIDGSMTVWEWERMFGSQVKHLEWVNDQLPYCLFTRAGLTVP